MNENAPVPDLNAEQTQAELQKIQLEIENLKLDIDSKEHLRKFGIVLQLLPLLTVIVAICGVVFSLWQFRSQQEDHQKELSDIAQREFMKPLLEKQLNLYVEASGAAATIASTSDEAERRKAKDTFWKLYWGPLVMVENKAVSGAMKDFGYCLDGTDTCTDADLKNKSLALASTLERSMLLNWNKKPDQFTSGQFDYSGESQSK